MGGAHGSQEPAGKEGEGKEKEKSRVGLAARGLVPWEPKDSGGEEEERKWA